MIFKYTIRSRRNRKGAAIVETAVVLPILLLMTFAIVDFGRAMMAKQVIVNASREGVRKAVVGGRTQQQVIDATKQYATDNCIKNVNVTLNANPINCEADTPITVTVSVRYADIATMGFFLREATLEASTTMRKERDF